MLAAALPGVSLAFGLTVVTGACAFGPMSGRHFNPAVSIGWVVGKRLSVLVCEVVMIAFFLIGISGANAKRAAGGSVGLTIGLCLTLIHLVTIPVSNTSMTQHDGFLWPNSCL